MNELEGHGAAWTEDRGRATRKGVPSQARGRRAANRACCGPGGADHRRYGGTGRGHRPGGGPEGALVAVTGRRREPGEALAAELTEAGTKALFVQADVADVAQARACRRR